MNTLVTVSFQFDLETNDGVSLTGEGAMEGTLEYDPGDYWQPPHTDILPALRTCWIDAVWMEEVENECEVKMEGREAYDLLETYGWSYDMLELSDWDEVEPYYDEDDYYED